VTLNPAQLCFALWIGHAIADYPLQGDFLAKAKNHKLPIPGIDWLTALIMHSLIHAGFVWAITGSDVLGVIEFVLHVIIDYLKCDGRTSFSTDQLLHISCKCAYVATMVMYL